MGKTAAELTPRERVEYRALARRHDRQESMKMRARRRRALAVAREAARVLKASFGVKRVLLFGSLATQSWFHLRSDIDLAAEGLRPRDYWRADCRLEEVGDGFEIDLVDLDTAPPALKEAVGRDGVEI